MQLNQNLKNPVYIIATLALATVLFFIHPVLLLLTVLLVLFVGAALLKPEWFLYALLFFFPWIGWSWTYAITPDSFLGQFVGRGVIELPVADIVGILALCVWGLNVLVKYFYQGDKTWKPQFPGWIFIVLLMISGVLALQNADVWQLASIKYLLRPILFAYIAFFLPVYNLARNPRAYRNILYVALALSVIGLLMGAWSFLGVFEHIHRAHPIAIAGYPFWGLNQNLLGELLIALLPVAALLFFLEKRGGRRAAYLSIFLGMILITLLTFSRTAWLALFLMAILGIYWLRKYLSKEFFAGVVIAGLLALPLVAYMINYSFNTYTAQSSNWGRWEMTQFAYFLWQEHPLIGNGAGTYFYRLEKTPMYTENLGTPFDAHGLLQKIGSEQGLLGLAAYLGFFGYLLWRLWRAYRRATTKNARIILALSMLILIGSVFYQGFNTNYFSAKLWVPAAIAFLAIKYYNSEDL
ncbi:MAG TPA: O-antigen ligase family protein [bacterium]|nr:O-antigen ligase family protein [bacterium]